MHSSVNKKNQSIYSGRQEHTCMETVEEPSGVPRSHGVLSVSRAALGVEEPQGSHGGVE